MKFTLIPSISDQQASLFTVLSSRIRYQIRMTCYAITLMILCTCTVACNTKLKKQLKDTQSENQRIQDQNKLIQLQYKAKTNQLIQTSEKLNTVKTTLEEQQWRLSAVCTDHPNHNACAPYTNAQSAKEVFCKDPNFVKHVNQVIKSCHQGQCKQLDQAQQIDRNQYMMLLEGLPHSLVTFKANQTALDRKDKKGIQKFLELLGGVKGYVVIVGRASKDGAWRHNIKLAVQRANSARKYIVNTMGVSPKKVGYITYGDEKMYLTALDIERLSKNKKRLSTKQANRSALIFSYPCYQGQAVE